MEKFKIAKQFDFCYGHRVWSQQLNAEYSLDSCTKCRHLHGHQGTIIVFLESTELVNGMVTDFKHLNWFKKWLDDTLDHKFIMDIDDPLREEIFPYTKFYAHGENFDKLFQVNMAGINEYYTLWENVYKNETDEIITKPYLQELYEGLIFVPFVPTSENLSRWLFNIIQEKMNPLGIKVSHVQFYETPKSQSNYYSE